MPSLTYYKAIPFSFALHIRRSCSTDAIFIPRPSEWTTCFLALGYGNTFLNTQHERAATNSRKEALHTDRHNSINHLPFVVTHNPSLPRISNILCKLFNIVVSSTRYREVFKHPPIAAYRRNSNLRDIIVKAKLSNNVIRNKPSLSPGSLRCE